MPSTFHSTASCTIEITGTCSSAMLMPDRNMHDDLDPFLGSRSSGDAQVGGAGLCYLPSKDRKSTLSHVAFRRPFDFANTTSPNSKARRHGVKTMTRLFPRPFLGLHPAFPDPDPDEMASLPTGWLPGGGLVGACAFAIDRVFRFSRRPFGHSAAVAAYSGLAFLAWHSLNEFKMTMVARRFLGHHGIQIPKRTVCDRLGCFDRDDAIILGSLGGLIVAARLRKPREVGGWQRWVGAAAIGSFAAANLQPFWHCRFDLQAMAAQRARREARDQQMRKYAPEIEQLFKADRTPFKAPVNAKPDSRPSILFGAGMDPMVIALLPETLSDIPQEFNTGQSPHIVTRHKGETEWIPSPVTNYSWIDTVDPAQVIPKLGKQMLALRARRRAYAQEAEFLWRWLGEKESEYLLLRQKSTDPQAEKETCKLYMYIRMLGLQHGRVWLAVSKMDLAIADTQKRVEQHRSLLSPKAPDENPTPSTSPAYQTPAPSNPELMLKTLHKATKDCDKKILEYDTQTEEWIRQLEAGKDPPGMALSAQAKGEVLADPNGKDRFRQWAARQRANVCAEKVAIAAVIRDGALRARGRREGGEKNGV